MLDYKVEEAYMISKITPKSFLRFSIIAISSIIIFLCMVSIYLIATNLKAESTYNAATKSLINNIKASKKVDADKETLVVSQKQVDDQFNEAKSPYTILMPHLLKSINHNAIISKELTKSLQNQLNQDKKDTDSNAQTSQNNRKNMLNKAQEKSNKSSLSNSQKSKIQDLLKQNNQSDSSQNSQNQSDQNSDDSTKDESNKNEKTKSSKKEDSSNKPW